MIDVLDRAPLGFALVDRAARFLQVNRAAVELLGLSRERLLGAVAWDVLPEPVAAALGPRFDRLLADGGEVDVEEYLAPLDAWVWVQASVSADGVSVWFRDVTARRAREENRRLLIEQMPALVWSTDRELRVLSVGGSVLGPDGAAGVGRTVGELVAADLLSASALAPHADALAGEAVAYEAVFDGRCFSAHVEPRRNASGEIVGVVGVGLDITERRRAEAALAARARQQEAIAELGLFALAERDTDLVARRVREAVARTLGVPVAAVSLAVADAGETPSGSAGGRLVAPVPGDNGPVGALAVDPGPARTFSGDDATFLRSAAHVLASALARRTDERRFRAVFDGGSDAMLLVDDERRYVDVNAAACDLLGRSREELLALRVDDVVGAGADAAWDAFLQAGEQRGDVDLARPDGTTRTFDFAAKAHVLPGLHLSVLRDVTEARSLEQQLRRAQRLESVGQLAGGIAHDFNNLLTAISGYAELVLARLEGSDPNAEPVREVVRAAARAGELTSQLLAFGRRQVLQPTTLALNGVVTEMAGLLGRLVGDDVDVVARLGDELPPVRADPAQLEQVVVNLAVNARDAMALGGTLTIATDTVELDPVSARRHPSLRPGRYARLTVSDTGCGMDAETLGRAFEPFFTTKEPGKGTGLGLSTVHGIVEQSGGAILASSEPGAGSTFEVYLPVAEAPPPQPAASPERVPAEAPSLFATVLVVEDEPLVRGLVREILESAGYLVCDAADGDDALRQADAGIRADLLVTDVVMPGLSGRALAEALGERWEGLRVVYMSGYSDDAVVRHGRLDPGSTLLQKPFSAQELLRTVRAALEAPAAAA